MLMRLLFEGLECHHDRVLVAAGAETWTAGRLLADVHRLALSDADLTACALALPNGYDLLVELIARIAAGCPPLLLNPAMPEAAQEGLANALGFRRVVRRRELPVALSPFVPAAFPGRLREDEAAYHLLAGGGTETPAADARTHRAVAEQVARLVGGLEYTAGERVAARFPFFEPRGLESVAFVCIRAGATLVV